MYIGIIRNTSFSHQNITTIKYLKYNSGQATKIT